MMSVSTLPIEVWTIIIKKLDTKSLCHLYESCSYLRNVICMQGVVKECNFSLNTLATVKSLKLDFLRDISGHLKTLNLSGVSDLNKSSLILALKRLKNLVELDISYTNIVMPDYHEIVKVSPTLKTLAINFIFGKKYKVTKNWLEDYQKAFRQLQNIHFVGSISDLLYGKLVIDMLKKVDLLSLTFTVCGDYYFLHNYADDDSDNLEKLKLSQFKVHFIKEILNDPLLELPIFKSLDIKKYEIVIFQIYLRVTVHATPLLKEFICKNYDVDVESLSELPPVVAGETAVMLWHRETTNFDSTFYSKLLLVLKEYLIFNVDSSNLKTVPEKYKWCSLDQRSLECVGNDGDEKEIVFKKARIAQPNFVLNYDEALRQKKDIKLRINFVDNITRPVTIKNSEYLKKISHLTLYGEVQFHPDFFKILFECCDSLVTLEILRTKGTVSIPKLLQFLPKCKGLKNILVSVSELLAQLFKYLCECKSLENIYLVNPTTVFETLPDPTDLFNKCDNIYNVCIQSNMPDLDKMFKFYKKVRSKLGKDGLNIDMFPFRDERRTSRYSPYLNVFDIHQLKPLAFV